MVGGKSNLNNCYATLLVFVEQTVSLKYNNISWIIIIVLHKENYFF